MQIWRTGFFFPPQASDLAFDPHILSVEKKGKYGNKKERKKKKDSFGEIAPCSDQSVNDLPRTLLILLH